MPTLTPPALQHLASAIFQAAGTPSDIADDVAGVLVENHLAGHDSHGVLRIGPYLKWVQEGKIVPDARPEVLADDATTAVVRGHRGFGQVAALVATDIAIEKALANRVSAVSVVDVGHTGRLAVFTERAARRGVMMFMAVGSGGPLSTVPFGGAAPSLGTNPISFAIPRGAADPITLDYATSAIANGKLMLAVSKGESVPPGNIVTKDGAPTTDPNDYYDGGYLLPFGGHKGYALAVVADLLAGPLAGGDAYTGGPMETGIFMFATAADAFRPAAEYQDSVERVADRIVSVPPAPGFDRVMLPGDPEAENRRQRLASGIPLPESTWSEIGQIAKGFGIEPGEYLEADGSRQPASDR